jgi:prephenate dehydratase
MWQPVSKPSWIGRGRQQAEMKAAFQGEPGAYSEEAGYGYFTAAEMVPHESFDAVFEAVASGECESGLIPIENSLAGSIHQNYDLLLRYELFIVGECFLRVRHCLIGFPGVKRSDIRRVISHPQALGQCAAYLRELGVKTEPVYDTAGSVKMLKSSGDKSCAAIASKRAAEIYGMQILQEGIEDNSENFTRFLEIAAQPVKPNDDAKTSIVFTLKNQPGALFNALKVFAQRDIDLTKIESRPLVGKIWEYLFYVDFIGARGQAPAQEALDQLGEFALMLRVLGSYPRYKP